MSTDTTVVRTSYGTVAGIAENGVTRFLGIPYAAAPIGANRFGAPVAHPGWDGVRDAYEFGPTAPKPEIKGELGKLMPDPSIEGEEWLNLNVWTPDVKGERLPVLVWIHGGAFVTGSSAVTAYDGATFARDGVVCVTINYRLGVEGFGYLPDAPVPANRGLRDQIFALEWVRDNIEEFGGNPGDVTLFGESAGGMSAMTLLSLDLGLFRRVIAQSATGHIAQSADDAQLVTKAVAAELDVEPTAEAFAKLDPEEIIGAQAQISAAITTTADPKKYGATTIASCGMSFMPVIDNDLLTKAPIDAIAGGKGHDVELLLGTNTEEFRLFVVPTDLVYWSEEILFRLRLGAYGVPDGTYNKYRYLLPNPSRPYPRPTPATIACAVLTDRMFRIPSYRVAEARANAQAATHVYEFGWRSPVVPNTVNTALGACHALEIAFVWDTLSLEDSKAMTGPTPPQELADTMHRTWVEFAKTGTLGWDQYKVEDRAVMSFSHDNKAEHLLVHDPRKKEREAWTGELEPS
ncbi:carboxylesterase/lipase family protein [Solihabitans fulvus]|uniref:Carboxylic ester hydrolase n=1 Tax=Solihabitans fulvus TaxID=1892852 RepID=A0A5B2WUS3_9PSEU|nr:carboxylesterase family protein [Solihabitans fulvus]KAA2255471.1 carboxylesterase/lipase family protein [Solihabitans fulvus]